MNQLLVEECSVCWRSFSTSLVPISLLCGHSFCGDCSSDLRKCPLCRRRLQSGYTRSTNYSLLSLVNRLETAPKKETRDQEVQTEKQPRPYTQRQMGLSRTDGNPQTLALSVILKLTKVQDMVARCFRINSNSLVN